MEHQEYLKRINEAWLVAKQHPFLAMIIDNGANEEFLRITFLNGCHASRDIFQPLLNEVKAALQTEWENQAGASI